MASALKKAMGDPNEMSAEECIAAIEALDADIEEMDKESAQDREKMEELLAGIQEEASTYPSTDHGDHHDFVMPIEKMIDWGHSGALDETIATVKMLVMMMEEIREKLKNPKMRKELAQVMEQYAESLAGVSVKKVDGVEVDYPDKTRAIAHANEIVQKLVNYGKSTVEEENADDESDDASLLADAIGNEDEYNELEAQASDPLVSEDEYEATKAKAHYWDSFNENCEAFDLEDNILAKRIIRGHTLAKFPRDEYQGRHTGPSLALLKKAKARALQRGCEIEQTLVYMNWEGREASGAKGKVTTIFVPSLDQRKQAEKTEQASKTAKALASSGSKPVGITKETKGKKRHVMSRDLLNELKKLYEGKEYKY